MFAKCVCVCPVGRLRVGQMKSSLSSGLAVGHFPFLRTASLSICFRFCPATLYTCSYLVFCSLSLPDPFVLTILTVVSLPFTHAVGPLCFVCRHFSFLMHWAWRFRRRFTTTTIFTTFIDLSRLSCLRHSPSSCCSSFPAAACPGTRLLHCLLP